VAPRAAICGQAQVDEDHAALDHVQAEVGVDAGGDQRGHQGSRSRSKIVMDGACGVESRHEEVDVVVEGRK
jgi:hypothetical protein